MFISMSSLTDYETTGNRSFGNELFQYAALKIYAKKHGLTVEIPEKWIGREIFNCDDPVISDKERKTLDCSGYHCAWRKAPAEDCDIKGYFQYHTSVYAEHKEYFKELFALRKEILGTAYDFTKKLKSPLICIHIRRGDYKRPPNRVAPLKWYTDWLDENLSKYDNPTIFVASDEIGPVIEELRKYNPIACRTDEEGLGMVMDHYIMQNCDVLLASNSTFSFTAAMLNEGGEFYRPDYQDKKLVLFDPWDSDPISPFPHHMKATRLHLGCGNQRLPGYINIDCEKSPATDLICDIKKLPYDDNSVDTIESYHVFEHIPVCLHTAIDSRFGEKYKSLIDTLKEWLRVLKPDGNLVIEMPDLDGIIKEYVLSNETRREQLLVGIYGSYRNANQLDIHRWGANEKRLRHMLEKAGFRDIKFCEAQDYHKDSVSCLRVEAVK